MEENPEEHGDKNGKPKGEGGVPQYLKGERAGLKEITFLSSLVEGKE